MDALPDPAEASRVVDPDVAAWAGVVEGGRWFASLPPSSRERLLAAARVRRVPARAVLFRRGDDNAGLYCVVEGSVQIGASDLGTRESLLGVLEPPQWFGEIACLDGGPRTHDAVARTDATLLLVPLAAWHALAEAEPGWWRDLGRLLAEKVRALFAGIEDLTQLPAPARIARRLLAMSHGHGMRADGTAQRSIAVNQEQLGAMLALTRQTVSEVLRDFESRGWVRRGYGSIELLDEAALRGAIEAPSR